MHPTPGWVSEARKKKRRRELRLSDAESDAGSDDEEEDDIHAALRTTAMGKSKRGRRALPTTTIDVTRLRDANFAATPQAKSRIEAISFHPSVNVLFAASSDRRLRLYQIDGTHNPLLQSVHIPELPITSAAFDPQGSSILLTGQRPFFYAYDLESGRVRRSVQGLWRDGGDNGGPMGGVGSMEHFSFSPDGATVAVAGRSGYVHLLDWGKAGSGGGQVIGSLKANGPVRGLAWNKDGRELVSVGEDARAYVWDVRARRCVGRWLDEGGPGTTEVAMDGRGSYFATGSRSGVVNVYGANEAFERTATDDIAAASTERRPLKAIMNLTTAVSTLRFNPDAQLLATASRAQKDSFKLVHLPSLTVFSNWPRTTTPLGHVRDVAFSKRSDYLAIGNDKGNVLLYSLLHYARSG
jgi:U3 small nucleolar RNA-associated protein 18